MAKTHNNRGMGKYSSHRRSGRTSALSSKATKAKAGAKDGKTSSGELLLISPTNDTNPRTNPSTNSTAASATHARTDVVNDNGTVTDETDDLIQTMDTVFNNPKRRSEPTNETPQKGQNKKKNRPEEERDAAAVSAPKVSAPNDTERAPTTETAKRRQSFASTAEVFNIDASSPEMVTVPTKLADQFEVSQDNTTDKPIKTLAELLQGGPEGVSIFPTVVNPEKDIRYRAQVIISPSDDPKAFLADKVTQLFKALQSIEGMDKLGLATWSNKEGAQKFYWKSSSLPESKDHDSWTAIHGSFLSLKAQDEGLAFIRLRFVTQRPDKLSERLPNLGKFKTRLESVVSGINFTRDPIPCQAMKPACVGWLFASHKWINSDSLLKDIVNKAKIPAYVPIGLQWRAIKDARGFSPKWVQGERQPMALHIDIDSEYASVYEPILANVFKKHGKLSEKPRGLDLRLVPCFGTDTGKNATETQREAMGELRDKQEYLVHVWFVKISSYHILSLQRPTGSSKDPWSLYRYLKSLTPSGQPTARLIHSIDKAWNDPSETIIITTKAYHQETLQALRTMIPYCAYRWGTGCVGWFTNKGIRAFEGQNWDPARKTTISEADKEVQDVVEEDYFGMGDAWKKEEASKRPGGTTVAKTAPPPASFPTKKNSPSGLINSLSAKKGGDVASLGSVYNRPHDGDTAFTTRVGTDDAASVSTKGTLSHEDKEVAEIIDVDMEEVSQATVKTKTSAKTAETSRVQREEMAKELADMKDLIRKQAEQMKMYETMHQEYLQARLSLTCATSAVTPSAHGDVVDTAADSVDKQD